MGEFLIEVWVDVGNKEDAEDIAHDISEILGDSGITNSVKVIS